MAADLDRDGRPDSIYRANLQSFSDIGYVRNEASVNSVASVLTDAKDILLYEMKPGTLKKNVIRFIGDAMGQT